MPETLTLHSKLSEMARNFWWSWQPEAAAIFRAIDPVRWSELEHNPVLLLREYTPEKLEERAQHGMLHASVHRMYREWHEYMQSDKTWGDTQATILGHRPVAYFSAEFGLHESLPIYSGGLGLLAGDHLKSASDLGVPLVGVGLFYDEGYFSQKVDAEGWQREDYIHSKTSDLPMHPALDKEGQPVRVMVQTRTGTIHATVWEVHVGRVRLFLLNTDVPENSEEDRNLTSRLYSGGTRTRIRQEIMLWIGGLRALAAMGIRPGVLHMNEGHSAFVGLEMISMKMQEDGLSFDQALRDTAAMSCFTTHTPVPAGHDRFDSALVEEHVGPLADQLGLDHHGLMGLGRVEPQNEGESFCMTVLAFKVSRRANAVSSLHGVVSRRMWAPLWPWRSEEEIPIGHITNGVHVPSWLAQQIRVLYNRVLPLDWYVRTGEPTVWAGFENVTPGELWETHNSLKNRLIQFVRYRTDRVAKANGGSPQHETDISNLLDPNALTIGFARRFAPYKRADLVMRDLENFRRVLTDVNRPVQIIYAGKAHPRDDLGKEVMRNIIKLTGDESLAGRVVFVENYDINVARHLIQGVDVWLNNPRRPLEASGTSGQKVVLNGGLNLSVLDGWWCEGYDGKNGFAIGGGQTHVDPSVQDQRDAEDLVRVLNEEVIPIYYDRDHDDIPQAWVKMMKRSVRTLGWRFNADRMVMDYTQNAYVPAAGGMSCVMPPAM